MLEEQEERGLERIVGLVVVPQNSAADAEHHRPVPLDQGRERGITTLAPAADKSL
jgi:hypothetical protein